jgi:hypothetical protein
MDAFLFEGTKTTARALKQTMTAYSEGALQTALENGCQDRASVLDFLSRRENARDSARVMAGRKAARMPASRVTIVQRSKEWA